MSGPVGGLNANDPSLYFPVTDWGTFMGFFNLQMALAPGMTEATRIAQLNKAIAYWTTVQATPKLNPLFGQYAATALTWLNNELARVENPPSNALSVTYPV